MNLLDTTNQLIQYTRLPPNQIAEGAGVKPRWLHYFLKGRYSDPGVKKVQRVHDFLAKHSENASTNADANIERNT